MCKKNQNTQYVTNERSLSYVWKTNLFQKSLKLKTILVTKFHFQGQNPQMKGFMWSKFFSFCQQTIIWIPN